MKTDWIVKLNFLVLGFALTMYFIYQVNTRGLSPQFLAIFGMKPSAAVKAQPSLNSEKLSWCETRVSALLLPEKMKLIQDGSQWVVESSVGPEVVRRAVDFISVEKWFARFCNLAVEKPQVAVSETSATQPLMMVKYVTGDVGVLKQTAQGDLVWKGQVFKSQQFFEAVSELLNLPPAARSKE